jgi:hypothetical protein
MLLEFRISYVEFDTVRSDSHFSWIYLDDRMQILEVHFADENLANVEKNRESGPGWFSTGSFWGEDVEGNIVKGYGLQIIAFNFQTNKAKFRILSRTEKFKKNTLNPNDPVTVKNKLSEDETLYVIEVDGLEIQHEGYWEKTKNNSTSWNVKEMDYTTTRLKSKRLGNNTSESPLYFRRLDNGFTKISFFNDEIGREFPVKSGAYKKIREHFISLLEFLNGGEIKVIKECFGEFYTPNKSQSEIVVTYSHFPRKDFPLNNFIPLSHEQSRGSYILKEAFNQSFDTFIDANEKYDLKKLITSLNYANYLLSDSERFKILVITCEAIAERVLQIESPTFKSERIPEEIFKPIKEALFKVLDENKGKVSIEFEDGYNDIKSRIGGVNQLREKNKEKIKFLLDFCNIKITEDLNYFIEEIRNSSVHEDIIHVDFKEENKFCDLLNDVLRFVIVNLMKYRGHYHASPDCEIINVPETIL